MEMIRFRLTGDAPILMHNNQATDPLHHLAKAMKKISSVKSKTDEHHKELAWIEYQASIYFHADKGAYIPGHCIGAMIRDAARLSKKGTTVIRALQVLDEVNPLIYDGPRSIRKLYDQNFLDRRPVGVNRSTVIRTRPMFPSWAVEFTATYEPKELDELQIIQFLEMGGKFIGLLDYRPTYGKFTAEQIPIK